MMWGCFTWTSAGDLVKIGGTTAKEYYKKILEENAIPPGLRLLSRKAVFQQNNDPKHAAKIRQGYLRKMKEQELITLIKWPSQSPDLESIQYLLKELDRGVRKYAPSSATDVWKMLQNAWKQISSEKLRKLIERMPRGDVPPGQQRRADRRIENLIVIARIITRNRKEQVCFQLIL